MKSLIDIVVLVHNKYNWADLAIRAVETNTSNPFRLIVVDNGSTSEGTKKLLAEVRGRGHTVLRMPVGSSFSAGMNAGVAAGDSKFIFLLGDDGIVTEHWDEHFLKDLSDKHTGLTGCRSNYASGPQGDPSWPGTREPPFIIFVCVGTRRDIWNVVGPMDSETFDAVSTEDIDWSWRVVKAGYHLKVSDAFVLHAGSRSITSAQGADGVARMNAKYNARLVEKWGKEWSEKHSKISQRVLVASYHAEEWTRVRFMGELFGLKRSDGYSFTYYQQTRLPIHAGRQLVSDFACDNGFDYLIQLDDDSTFPNDVVRRLLSHDKPLVAAVAYQRRPPHLTCAFEMNDEGLLGRPLEGIEHTGLRKVDVTGLHVSCTKMEVIRKLRDGLKGPDGQVIVPGTRLYFGGFDNKLGEDFAHCILLKRLGIPVYVDTDLIAGHIGANIVVDEKYKAQHLAGNGVLT